MNYEPQTDDAILRQVLYRANAAQEDHAAADEADELLDLFLAGRLTGEDREAFLRYLDTNPSARTVVAASMQSWEKEAPQTISIEASKRSAFPLRRFAGLALAASLLVATAVVVWRTGNERALLARNRVNNLTELGYEFGGIAFRETTLPAENDRLEAALASLDQADQHDVNWRLNRGFILLRLSRPEDAQTAFQEALHDDPRNVDAWLGNGMASFILAKFNDAELAFRTCLELEPGSIHARINLAMTLTELDRVDEALGEWRKVDRAGLSLDQQRAIEAEIQRLEQHQQQ
jgi:tetratricopeptide (TPR) repeat protein